VTSKTFLRWSWQTVKALRFTRSSVSAGSTKVFPARKIGQIFLSLNPFLGGLGKRSRLFVLRVLQFLLEAPKFFPPAK